MKKISFNIITLFCLTVSFAQTPKETGTKFINHIFQQQYDQAFDLFDNSVKSKLTTQALQNAVEAIEINTGKFKTILESNEEKRQQFTTLYFYSQFEKSKQDIKIICNAANSVVGFFIAPHKQFDTDSNLHKTFNKNDRPLNIKVGAIELPGIILQPHDSNNIKIIAIFVHGSGPQDKDETIGENKPFKDLADGLYKYRISSFRFDKRTLVAPQLFSNNNYTIDDEVTNDIYSIVSFFRNSDTFKNYKIILIGHSLGGMLLPKIADSLKSEISGIVMLAANARPLETLLLEQYKYLYSLDPNTQTQEEIKKLSGQINFLHSKDFNPNTSNASLPLNLPFSYWNSLLKYDQTKTIKKITTPILILQGLRDYQVTITDLYRWRKALKKNRKTSFNSYPKLNHLFMEGEGKSTPQEYLIPSHIPQYVIDDITIWINKLK